MSRPRIVAVRGGTGVTLHAPSRHALTELGYGSYRAYLGSTHWQTIRRLYRLADLPQDCPCGKAATNLHHQSYELLGREWEDLSCLKPLCRDCHKFLHNLGPRPTDFCLTPRGRLRKTKARV